jgi:uncharacterized membrane protein YuzA (DUF378 family)
MLLVLAGIGLCGYATAQQLGPLHDVQLDVILFVVGILLVSFSFIRRVLWNLIGLTAVWGTLVWLSARFITQHDQSFSITPELLATIGGPPLLVALFLEITRREVADATDLEISLSEPKDPNI